MDLEYDPSEWVEHDGGEVNRRHRRASRIRVASDVTTIPPEAFRGLDHLRAVDLSNVSTISKDAFNGCVSLVRIIWPTVFELEVGESAFLGCRSLERVIWNTTASATIEIGRRAFAGCVRLREIDLSNTNAVKIGAMAFYGCRDLMGVKLGGGIQLIERRTFSKCRCLVRINIPSSVTDIGEEAFQGCSSLREVTLHEGLQHIGKRAFQKCTSLPRIAIPSTTLKVGRLAFAACDQLRCVALEEGLQMIGAAAFLDCHSLERITIPSSVTLVGGSAFGECRSLAEVTLREGIHYIEDGAFELTLTRRITVPSVALLVESNALKCRLTTKNETRCGWNKKLIVSRWMQYRSQSQLDQAEAKVNEILARTELNMEEKVRSIREWFAYCDQVDVTTILELAIWKCSNGNEQGAEARQAIRRSCGNDMGVVIHGALRLLGYRIDEW